MRLPTPKFVSPLFAKAFLPRTKSLAVSSNRSMLYVFTKYFNKYAEASLFGKCTLVRAGTTMKKVLFLSLAISMITACASKNYEKPSLISVEEKAKKIEKAAEEPKKVSGIVVDAKDLQVLEKMNKAVEVFVLKNEKSEFMNLCKDMRFDCFVDEKSFPNRKKKILRKVPPYASGSKMGLQGETRVHVKYDFYP